LHEAVVVSEKVEHDNGANRKAHALRWLGFTELKAGCLEPAQSYCQASLRLANQVPDYNIIASCLGLMAALAAQQGQPTRASCLSGAAAAMYARQKRKPWEDSTLDTLLPGWRAEPEARAERSLRGWLDDDVERGGGVGDGRNCRVITTAEDAASRDRGERSALICGYDAVTRRA
jgi:hypothetical protein